MKRMTGAQHAFLELQELNTRLDKPVKPFFVASGLFPFRPPSLDYYSLDSGSEEGV